MKVKHECLKTLQTIRVIDLIEVKTVDFTLGKTGNQKLWVDVRLLDKNGEELARYGRWE